MSTIDRDIQAYSPMGSDSSMVDEYAGYKLVYLNLLAVQIPLWSMSTLSTANSRLPWLGSDSSMVDEYAVVMAIATSLSMFRFLYGRWVLKGQPPAGRYLDSVQIPLWSMSTSTFSSTVIRATKVQIPLWSMSTGACAFSFSSRWSVQIPLWSMSTLHIFPSTLTNEVQIPLWSMSTGTY